MIKNMLIGVSSLVLSGAIFVGSVYACSEDFRDRRAEPASSASSSESFFEEGEDVIEVFLRPGFAAALDCMNQFSNAFEQKNYVLATQSYEKALEHYPAFKFPGEMKLGGLYLRLLSATTVQEEKDLYLQKAQNIVKKTIQKKKDLSLDDWRVVRDVAMRMGNLEELSQANDKIMSLLGNPTKIDDVVPLFFQFHQQGLYDKAHKMLKIVLRNKRTREVLAKMDRRVGMVCFELCALCKDSEGMLRTLSFVEDKKAFFEQGEIYLYHAYYACLECNDYKGLLSLMKTFSSRDSLTEIEMIACLSELEKDYKEALLARERMLELDSSRASYEELLAFCERAAKAMRTKSQKKPFLDRVKKIKQILAAMELGSGAAQSSERRQSVPSLEDMGRTLRNIIANKHMDTASQLLASLPSEEWPELGGLREEVIVNFKQCQMMYERICSGDASMNISNMYLCLEKMRTALKRLGSEKEKIFFRRRQELVVSSSVDAGPILMPAPVVNLRKEVLEAHGLSQKREKPAGAEEFIDPFVAPCPLILEDDIPYEIEWVWTSKTQKEREGLSLEKQAKLEVFMAEVARNPWSVRRDGSLASGEPRHIVGYGPNSYERDMDAYNRFIYSVIATGPKSAKVLVLGVQGHL